MKQTCNIVLFACLLICSRVGMGQPPLQWVKLAGATVVDARLVTVDNVNSVLLAGTFAQSCDFDPSAAVYSMTASPWEPFILKLDTSGKFEWARKLDCNMGDAIVLEDIEADIFGNVYLCGWFNGFADLDPGPGTYTVVAGTGARSGFLIKLSSQGFLLWAREFSGDEVLPVDLTLDHNEQVYVAGNFNGSADFTPGAPSNSFVTNNKSSFLLKVSPSGSWRWVRVFSGASAVKATCMNYYGGTITVAGNTGSGVDFDPGPQVQVATGMGGFLCHLDTATGGYINASFVYGNAEVWEISASDSLGVLVGGSFKGVCDFDTGPANYIVSSSGYASFIMNQTPAGQLKWVRTFGNGKGGNTLIGMRLIPAGSRFYVSTYLYADTFDIDPGPGVVMLAAHRPQYGWRDITFSQFDSTGTLLWAYSLGPTGYYAAHPPVVLDGNNALISIGIVVDSLDADPSPSIKMISGDSANLFIQKLSSCMPPALPAIQVQGLVCTGSPATLIATGPGTVNWFNSASGGSSLATGSLFVTPPVMAPTQYYASAHTCAWSFGRASVTVSPLQSPQVLVTASNTFVCAGGQVSLSASGAQAYTWNNGLPAQPSNTISPSVTTSYIVTGYAANGCSASDSVWVVVDACTSAADETGNAVRVFPNPVTDELMVILPAESLLELLDGTGKVIFSQHAASGTATINMAGLPRGTYLMRISGKSGVQSRTVIR